MTDYSEKAISLFSRDILSQAVFVAFCDKLGLMKKSL
jgi:hypothetical protein